MQFKTGKFCIVDRGERRWGVDRRTFSYTCYIPERRSGSDRRTGRDRRGSKRLDIIPQIEASQTTVLQDTSASP
jgi:hypothetical protein